MNDWMTTDKASVIVWEKKTSVVALLWRRIEGLELDTTLKNMGILSTSAILAGSVSNVTESTQRKKVLFFLKVKPWMNQNFCDHKEYACLAFLVDLTLPINQTDLAILKNWSTDTYDYGWNFASKT